MTNWPACGLLSCIRRQALVKRQLNQEGWWWHRQWEWRLPSLFSLSLSPFWFQPDETALPGRQSQAQFHSQSGRSRCRAGRREKGFPTILSWKLSKLVHNAALRNWHWLLIIEVKEPHLAWLLVGPSGRPVCMLYDSDPWPWYMHVCMIHDPWCMIIYSNTGMYVIYDVCINDGGSPERDGVGHKEQIVQLLWNKVGKMFGPEARLEMNRTKMTRAANANNTWEFQFNLFHLYQFLGWF